MEIQARKSPVRRILQVAGVALLALCTQRADPNDAASIRGGVHYGEIEIDTFDAFTAKISRAPKNDRYPHFRLRLNSNQSWIESA
jgi:hypothetical protein